MLTLPEFALTVKSKRNSISPNFSKLLSFKQESGQLLRKHASFPKNYIKELDFFLFLPA